jgi:hypothetical protein
VLLLFLLLPPYYPRTGVIHVLLSRQGSDATVHCTMLYTQKHMTDLMHDDDIAFRDYDSTFYVLAIRVMRPPFCGCTNMKNFHGGERKKAMQHIGGGHRTNGALGPYGYSSFQ